MPDIPGTIGAARRSSLGLDDVAPSGQRKAAGRLVDAGSTEPWNRGWPARIFDTSSRDRGALPALGAARPCPEML